MNEFISVLTTLAVSAPVFLGGGIFLGYRYGKAAVSRAQAEIDKIQGAAKAVNEVFRNPSGPKLPGDDGKAGG